MLRIFRIRILDILCEDCLQNLYMDFRNEGRIDYIYSNEFDSLDVYDKQTYQGRK